MAKRHRCTICGQKGHKSPTCALRNVEGTDFAERDETSNSSVSTFGHDRQTCPSGASTQSGGVLTPSRESSALSPVDVSTITAQAQELLDSIGELEMKEHQQMECSEAQKEKMARRNKCSICGQKGHNSRTCPLNNVERTDFAEDGETSNSSASTFGHDRQTCPSGTSTQGSGVLVPAGENSARSPVDVSTITAQPRKLLDPIGELEMKSVDGHQQMECSEAQKEEASEMETGADEQTQEAVKEESMDVSDEEEESLIGSVAEEKMEEDVAVIDVEGDGPLTCACCHRKSVEDYPINLRALPRNFVRRKYGDSTRLEQNSLVCWQCWNYVKPLDPKWVHAWPAVLYSFLTRRRFKLNHRKLIEFLPYVVREMYANVQKSREIRAQWERDPLFVDITIERQKFLATLGEYRMHTTFLTMENYPVPTILCMMGCTLFIDDEVGDKMHFLPACHYLSTISSELNGFGANSSYFRGARPDWPCQFKELNRWQVSPSIHIDRERGLCIAMCGPSVHADGRSQYLHVPRHPILKEQSPLVQDVLAPVVVTPNIIRQGHTNERNTSYAVLKQRGSVGLGTFTLMPRAVVKVKKRTRELEGAYALTLRNRPEIAQSFVEDSRIGEFLIEDLVKNTSKELDYSPKVASPVVGCGTFIDIADVMHTYKAFEHRMEGAVQDDRRPHVGAERSNHLDCLQLTHRADDRGLAPLDVPKFCRHRDAVTIGSVLHVTIHCLVHCRPLHRALLKQMWSARNNALHQSVNKMVKAVATGSRGPECSHRKAMAVEGCLMQALDIPHPVPSDLDLSAVVVQALRYCCRAATVSLNGGALDVLMDQRDDPIVIVDAHDSPVRRDVEVETGSNYYLLLAAHLSFQEDQRVVKLTFRWQEGLKWYTVDGGKTLVRESPGRGPWQVLVYATRNEKMCLQKEEFLNFSGGQSKMRCSIHPRFYLMKELSGNELRCCHGDCNSDIRWRCSYGHGTKVPCVVGVCLSHGRHLMHLPTNTLVPRRPVEDTRVKKRVVREGVEARRPQAHQMVDDTCGDAEAVTGAGEEELVFRDMLVDVRDFQADVPVIAEPVAPSCNTNLAGVSSHLLERDVLKCVHRVSLDHKPPVVLQQMLQHLHSIIPENYFPFLYPEGALFPTIFYKSIDGAVVGALPSPSYSDPVDKKRAGGLANLEDHMQVRMRDSQSLTSRDPDYIGFAFDTVLNRTFRYNSCSVAVKKGLENIGRLKVHSVNQKTDTMSNHIDSRRQLKRLGSMVREAQWDYLMTITLNESDTVGIRVIREAAEAIHPRESEELKELLQNMCVLMSRVWARWVKIFFEVVLHSPEQPLGRVRSYWVRMEFQDKGAMGNHPHVHAGITLQPGSNSKENLRRIVKDSNLLFCQDFDTDFESLKKKGLVKDLREFLKLCELGETLTKHDCVKIKFRCQKGSADGSMACRIPRHPPSFLPSFKESPTKNLYDYNARVRLVDVGLAYRDNYGDLQVENSLIGKRWQYPTRPNVTSVPVVPQLFVICRSVISVQLCDRHMTTSYMCNYLSGVDEKSDAVLTVKDDAPDVLNVDALVELNTDVDAPDVLNVDAPDVLNTDVDARPLNNGEKTGAAKAEQRLRANAPELMARELSLSEMTWFNLDLPYYLTNVEFVEVSTEQPDYRRSAHKSSRETSRKLVAEDGSLECVNVRVELPAWRQWSRHQELMIWDCIESSYYADRTTSFSVRPPELRSIRRLEAYFKWFVFDACKEFVASENLSEHPLIDGCCRRVRIRIRYLESVKQHFESVGDEWRESAAAMLQVIQRLEVEVNRVRFSDHFLRFVSPEHRKECIVVFSPISPDQFDRFLVHLILTLGSFDTELEVYSCRTLLHALQHVRLIKDALNPTEEDALRLAKNFVNDQLQYYSIGAREFHRLVAVCLDKLRAFMAQRIVPFESMPLATYRSIKEQAKGKLVSVETAMRTNLVNALLDKGLPTLPNVNDLRAGRPVRYDPQLKPLPNQTQESFDEQVSALNHVRAAVDSFVTPNDTFVRFPLLLGPPGAGKTHVLLTACAYALSKALRTMLVAVTSERARELGGEHVHLLFCIPFSQSAMETPNITANKCVLKLARNPVRMAFLKRLDVIIFEEVGLLPLSLYVVMDIVLRHIRDNPVPFGGILMIASGDSRQLPPVEGSGIWQSAQMSTVFTVLYLRHYVRSRRDLQLQRIISLMRKCLLNEEEVESVVNVLAKQQFVNSWDDVADGVLRVVSKREAEREAVRRFLQKKSTVPGLVLETFESSDTVAGVGANWRTADSRVSKQLDYQLAETRELVLFPGAVMRVTFNNVNPSRNMPRFSQGQLVVITRLPDSALPPNEQRVEGRLVPPGQRVLDVVNIPDAWQRVSFSRHTTYPVVVGCGTKAKRLQWPLCHCVCSTIHKVLGDTVPRLATQISTRDQKYSLWQKEQLLTVLSRVEELHCLTFVGSKKDTLAAVSQLLRVNDPLAAHVEHVLTQFDVLRESPRVTRSDAPFTNPLPCEVPSLDEGFVYIFVNVKLPKLFKFGSCCSIRKELYLMNSSVCRPNLRAGIPWVALAFVYGFSGTGNDELNEQERQRFETAVYNRARNRVPTTKKRLADLVEEHECWIRSGHSTLVLKQCYEFVSHPGEVSDVGHGFVQPQTSADFLPSSSDVTSVPATTCHELVYQGDDVVVQPVVTPAAPQASSVQVIASPQPRILRPLRIAPTVANVSSIEMNDLFCDVEGNSVHGAGACSPTVAVELGRSEVEPEEGARAHTEGLAVEDTCSSVEDCDENLNVTEEEELLCAVQRSLDDEKVVHHTELSLEELRARVSRAVPEGGAGSSGACITGAKRPHREDQDDRQSRRVRLKIADETEEGTARQAESSLF